MPIYEYTCSKCGALFEELVPSSRRDEKFPCPSCGEKESERNLSSFAALQGGAQAPPCAATCNVAASGG